MDKMNVENIIETLRKNAEKDDLPLPIGFKERLLSQLEKSSQNEKNPNFYISLFSWKTPLEKTLNVAVLLIAGILFFLLISITKEVNEFKKNEFRGIAFQLASYKIEKINEKDIAGISRGILESQEITVENQPFSSKVYVTNKDNDTKKVDVEVTWKDSKSIGAVTLTKFFPNTKYKLNKEKIQKIKDRIKKKRNI